MTDDSLAFFKRLLETPSPSGFERPVQNIVRKWAANFADHVETDLHGNVHAVINSNGSPTIMLAGHCDQIGLMVQHIDDHGYLFVQPIGGWDMQILLGQKLTVWGQAGPIDGVISRIATHLLTPEEKKKVPDFTDVWIDIGATDRSEAEELVSHGDPVTFSLGYQQMRNGCASAPGMDDKTGLWTVMETLRLLAEKKVNASVHCVSTVQEEVGLRGARTSSHSINPDIGIAVDVCHATDTPGSDKRKIGDIRVGDGPVVFRGPNINPHVFSRLKDVAKSSVIPIQTRGAPRATGTDANAIQLAQEGVATALIGIPNRYMHTPVEVVSLNDLTHASQLLADFCSAVTSDMDWRP